MRRYHRRLEFDFKFRFETLEEFKKIAIPERLEPASRERRDELWRHTCLEVFLGASTEKSYCELNLSPSGHWNVYGFDDYRAGMRPVAAARLTLSEFKRDEKRREFTWSGVFEGENARSLNELLGCKSGDCALVLGATAVIEYTTGECEYWALRHAGEKPDFHLRESFLLNL